MWKLNCYSSVNDLRKKGNWSTRKRNERSSLSPKRPHEAYQLRKKKKTQTRIWKMQVKIAVRWHGGLLELFLKDR